MMYELCAKKKRKIENLSLIHFEFDITIENEYYLVSIIKGKSIEYDTSAENEYYLVSIKGKSIEYDKANAYGKNDEKIEEINEISNRSTEEDLIPFDSKLVIHVCPVADYYVVIAYIPESLVEEIKSLPNVISCRKSGKLKKAMKEYNEKEILNKN
ncbi:hypothetical protein BCR32DRAFT_287991 [Anaeromyces robustus]|uniref:Uncharacterized protein n=1 Tax=Anaeromyces robustus TaxID=1754192 RepID=A0A1Y1VQ58_9FUNG|nr:hypothetical protein BCR32DRAFT_287991 [Anaeromyces robustus]|eukprot:ORX61833.1 hypothetical protein BCR32DRAFT_287991 [Anaeromyces robustus]